MRIISSIALIFVSLSGLAQSAENYGGKKEKQRIFEQELYYSEDALKNYYGGKVELRFVVDEFGYLDSFEVEKSVSKDLDKEAIRLLKLMLWEPARVNDSVVRSLNHIEFKFNPGKYPSICRQRGYELKAPDPDFLFTVFPENELSQKPKYSGKEGSFEKYVKDNLEYPEAAVKTGAQGFVELAFVVEPSGRLTNVNLLQSLEANCDIVARDLILNSEWEPGHKNGLLVRSFLKRKIFFSPSGTIRFITVPDKK